MRPDRHAAGGVDRVDRLRHRRGLAQAEGGAALDQVAADQRADVVDLLLAQTRGVGGRGEDGFGEVRAPDRLTGGDARGDRRVVELEGPASRRASAMRSVRRSRSARKSARVEAKAGFRWSMR